MYSNLITAHLFETAVYWYKLSWCENRKRSKTRQWKKLKIPKNESWITETIHPYHMTSAAKPHETSVPLNSHVHASNCIPAIQKSELWDKEMRMTAAASNKPIPPLSKNTLGSEIPLLLTEVHSEKAIFPGALSPCNLGGRRGGLQIRGCFHTRS